MGKIKQPEDAKFILASEARRVNEYLFDAVIPQLHAEEWRNNVSR